MKKFHLICIPALAGILMCYSCHNEPEKVPERTVKTLKIEKKEPLTHDPDAPNGHIRIEMDYLATNDSVSRSTNRMLMEKVYGSGYPSPQAAADSFATNYLKRYKEELQELYLQEKNTEAIRSWYQYNREIRVKNVSDSQDLIQYQIGRKYHEGGASDYEETFFLNFDARNGGLLTLDSIFKTGSRIELETLLLKQLEKEQDVKSLQELKEKGFLRLTNIYATGNFLLKEKGICFYYQRDELATYDKGPIEIHLTYKKLKNILTDKTKDLWSRF